MNPKLSTAERERILRMARAASLERSAPKNSPIVPVERGGRLAPSFAQQRLWFLEQLGELGSTYHIPEQLRLRGTLDRAALGRALERIVARHESLRTVFVLADGEPEQRILPVEESGFGLAEDDLRGEADAQAALERLVAREADAPFDLERGSLVRARLVRLAEDDHLLLLTMHHVVSDAWSMTVFTRELVALYTAFAQGQPDPLPALPVQYADYAAWQRGWLQGEVLEAQAGYWTRTLAGAPELLELPADHARPARQDHAGAALQVALGRELTAGLTALSHRHGTTLYMTVLAGWATVLARLSGQADVVIGTPSANRARPEVEELIGFFVNTLPLRVDLSESPSVAQLLAQVKTRALEGQRNQDIPFEQVVERLRPTRSLAYSPLFQVMLAWQNDGGGALELPGLTLAQADTAPHVTAKFDLLLSLGESNGELAGVVEYATSLFERETVERWMGYLRAVLEAMVADDAVAVDRLPMLAEAERRLVLRAWNATEAAYPREACVHELVEAQAARTPDAVAVTFEDASVTYAELNARANRLAHHLRALGVGPDVRVGICVERSMELVVGLLGILKSGGAYVPLDASYPVERLRNMVEDSVPAVLLTHPPQAATAAALAFGSALPVLDLAADHAWADRSAENPEREGLGPRNLAHVLFTSGSTGRPKGVMLEHGSLVNRLAWMQDRYGMTADEALLQKTPFSFDVSFWEFFWPLMVGARLVVARPDGHRDPAYLAEIIRREGITVAHFVPSMLQLFLEHPDAETCTGLLRVPVSGEAVSLALVRQFHARLPGVGLFNQYGPTESGEVTEWTCDPAAERVSIGRAIHNSVVYVLDRAGEPVPVGVAGELFIGGVAVARGYLGRPRLTAERFVPDPFGEPGSRMYRTGDLCRWMADGTVEYLGRTDFQVKVRGFRVELGEIEARLVAHPGVREAVVLATEDGAGGKRLVAYFAGEAVESEALRAHLSEQLPDYMVPAVFMRLEAFPVTPNGKLDRRALPAPDADSFAARAYEAPVGETEVALAGIWAELLGVERIGRRDDFFALGGHSLLAVRVVSRIRQALGVEAGISDLFVRPVLADFARGLQTAAHADLPAIVPVDRGGPLELSFAQQRLWFIERLEGAGAAYHLPIRLRLRGALDREALVRALERIVARHEALRTRFPETNGVPAQRIAAAEESPFQLVEHDLEGRPDAPRELDRMMADEAEAPFDLAGGPLIRGRLVRLGGDDHVLLITMHHIVSDGWSMGIFSRELSALYQAFHDGRPDPLPPLPVQYADYAAWQRRWVEGEVLRRQADYWRQTLSGAPELLELPADHARPVRQDFSGAWVPVELDEALAAALKALGQRHGATLHMTLLAGWAAVLARLSGQDDVVVGTPSANRGQSEIEGLIGFFVNTLALRVDLSGSPSVAELLGRVKERSLGAQQHQDIPFEQVVEVVQPARSLSHTPLFQVMFAWQNAPEGRLELPGLALEPLDDLDSGDASSQLPAKFDLSLGLWEEGGRIAGVMEYATALFERETVERWLGYLRRTLEEMVSDEAKPLDRLDLLSPAERRLVVEGWNATAADYPAGGCVHDLLAAQAARTPEAAALSWRGERLTYARLDARANQIAHALRRRGVGPEVRVGICLPRTLELVPAMLGVLKAGGAYVPLDPAYPPERLGYMIEDAAITLVMTDAALADALPEGAAALLLLDGDRDAIEAEPADAPESGVLPENLSHVIFTSGSTGRPKGVMIRHASVVVLLHWLRENVTDEERSSVLFSTSINFDVSVAEVFGTLAWGGTLVIVENALELAALDEPVVYASMVPSAAAELLRGGGIPASVKTLNLGGEALPNALAQGLHALGTVDKVGNLYGPTEDTTYSTYYVVPRGADRVLVGTPVANTQAYVLDHHLQPVPAGVTGELYLAGDGLSRGYANHPAMTAERFVPCPFGAPGSRMYRVMDRVRWRESAGVDSVSVDARTDALPHSRTAVLEYLGRIDFQVKVRGYRIELGEIEARLAEHAGVRAPVVLVREDAPGDRRLVAYYLADEPVAAEALKAHLAARLPAYMVPAAYLWMQAYPLTPNGKLDRKALPEPDFASAEGRYVAPRTPTEEVLAQIWAETLRLERAGANDNFFELGGHSLLATRVVSRIREVFGVELPLRALFEGSTVAEMALRVEEMRTAELPVLPPVVPVERTGPLPLSFAQERLWFLHQMEPEGADYNMPWPSRLRGRLDASALEQALDALVRRHEALRTTFHAVEQGAVQVVHPAAPAQLPVLDLTGLPQEAREDEAFRLAREEAARPFDLERGPLLRATLVRLADEEHVLLLTMHHIVSDGWSMGVLFRELFTLYESFSTGGEASASLPPLVVQYADFAVWQRGWLQGEVLRRELGWWREQLGGAPPALELPTDRPRPAVASSRGASHEFRLPAEITRGLRALARREGATLYMVTHAALDLLLSRWSGQEDLVVGSPIAGRNRVETEGLIGFFVNTLALRIDLSGDPSFQQLVRRVRNTALGAYAHQDLPFERLVEEVAPDRGLSHTPLFQVMFALQNMEIGDEDSIAGLGVEGFGGEIRTVRFDLELDLREMGDEVAGSLRFRTDLFDAATIERFVAQYQALLGAAAATPDERLSRLAILPDDEVRQILAFGAGDARDGAGDAPVHLLFAEQAARTPHAPALRFESESLTYAELDARAGRLARRLGVQAAPGATIGVCLERGPQAVVALLAIWKMGGVYLPMDPSHPVERLAFFLHDSGAKLVVSDLPLASTLVAREADVLLLDPRAEGELPGGEAELRAGRLDDLAYLIYTSGSTGTPKAVMVEHGQLTHTLRASLETLGFAAGDVVAALASTAFDISLLELITPFLAGGTVRVVPPSLARDPEELVNALADVTVLHAVPALMRQVVEVVRNGAALPSLRLLLVGGDSVPPSLLEDMRAMFPAAATRVLYGPTEATIICATYAVPAEGAVVGHPLGRPLANVRLAVRGSRGEMAPLGVPGEVWIYGGGVARGYLGRPELNAEKFVGTGTERAYRTGDRARWRADGVLEFLGRADEQVKVRGFRIEPGEVEAVLREQPGVREAVVLAREDAPGDRRLVAYVVPGEEVVEAAAGKEQVSEWETLFDDTYAQEEGEDPTLALKGWNSSYTGEPIPAEEMRAWAEDTVDRILALRPERVLEVGAGTGLLLFRVAPHTQAYVGTDFSAVALNHIRRHAAGLPQVSLAQREGDQLGDYAGAEFDVVIINSVAQYFPDLDYLLRVLDGAAAALRPGGRIFLGDVRSLPLARAFHASVELARAPEDLPVERLRDRVRRGVAEEQELLLDPALFEAVRARMPRLGRVEVQAKRGEYDNEVSRFRYDVVLHLDAGIDPVTGAAPVVREWGGEDVARLRALAAEASALLVRGVPDARVREHVRALELISSARDAATAGKVRALAADGAGDGIQPEALFALGAESGRAVEVRPGAAGTLDVLFHPAGGVSSFPADQDEAQPWETYANDPRWGRRMRALVPALREGARARLPEYMVPSAFVVLEAFPVTPNGKVDRAALPAPDMPGSRGTYVAPRTPAEERMAGIWAEVLGVERVGAEDHFFDLGGHSLLATQLVSRVREAFRTELPLRVVFEAPTLAQLAGRVELLRAEQGDAAAPPLVPAPRDGSPLPLSFAQQRLWFIDQLEPGSSAYNMPSALRLRGPLDTDVLERALAEVVRRHEALRTTFGEAEGVPFQVVHPAGSVPLEVTDLSAVAAAEREAEALRLAVEEAQRPFNLRTGPLFRTALLRLAKDDHVLVLAMHHVVSDGWSMGVLFRELNALYEAFARGEASPLPALPVQYADVAVWQRAWLGGAVLERQIGWWRGRMAGAPPLLELPTDHPRPAAPDDRAGHVYRALPPETADAVRALARREGATVYMVLLAALDLLLARWSGQEDVVVGTPIASRTRRETEGLIGFFVNTLALRTDLSGNPSFQALLGRVREATLGAYQHQEVPFERLVEELRVERSLSHTPLFQVMFALNDVTGTMQPWDGVAVEPYPTGSAVAKFDLDVMVLEQGGELGVAFTYREALWDAPTMERVAGAYALLLEAAAADPGRPVLGLPLVSQAEREGLVAGSSGPLRDYPAGLRVHDLVAAQAARTPHAPALVHAGKVLDYAGLELAANRLANHLRRLGAGPETGVGICLERGPELVVAMLAILKAGGAYVPLDPAYPRERLGYMLEDAGVTLVITHSALADRLPQGAAALLLLLDGDRDAIEAQPADAPESGVLPENLSHVIFTSGSTGRPKGVMIRHASVVVLLHWLREIITDEERSSVLFSTSINFDVSVAEVFGTLAWGGKLVIVENALELATLDEPVVYASMVPSAAAELLRGGGIPASVKTLNLGGEALPNALAQGLHALGTVDKVGNLYGPTEDTTYSTYYVVPRGADRVLVGRPVANTQAYVLDHHLQPVPAGVTGELYLAGDGLSRGYANHPAMTAERFVPSPFGAPGSRMYRVMDRVRRRTDGELEYLGRIDFQVKVRGYRIELGEIEARLAEHAGVRAPAVLVREDAPGDRRLVAYYLADEPVAAEALKAHLSDRLPKYMVPAAYVWLQAYPLTPNGKLDRRALPAPDFASAEDRYVAPRTPTEEVLAQIWAETLHLDRAGVTESFFELGGHSLLATRVVSRIRDVFAIELPLRALFEDSTVAELAVRVEDARRAALPVLPPVVPVERTGPLPLSFAQERLWFIDRLKPGSATYTVPAALRLTGALDPRALERSLGEIVRRHEALRTVFGEADGLPVQVMVPFGGFTLPVEELSGLGAADREAAVARRAGEEAQRAFDLAAGPLFHAVLLRLGAEDHVLLLAMHHIVSDGWSGTVLFEELSALYAAYHAGDESPLPELAVQYADYAVWQREQLAGAVLDRQLAYWRERLAGAPELLELPTDHPRPAMQTFQGATVPVEFSPQLLERLQALGRSEGTTLYMTVLGAFQVLLSKYSGSDDVVVGSPIAGRTRKEVEDLIGFFVNTLVLRTDLGGDPTFRETLRRVREATLGAYEHQEVPFEKLVAELQPERSLSHSPLFQVMFAVQNAERGGSALPGLEVSGVGAELTGARFDLSLDLVATAEGLRGGLNYSTDLFERGSIERMVGHLERVLEQVTADADVRLSRLELLGEAERRQVVEAWNATDAEYPADRCIHQLFEAQAARTPDAVAIEFDGESIGYGALNARANRLAHYLAGLRVGPETRVGICLERGAEMVVAALAVLKAGGAYVPLDPAYPAERLAFMLADAAVPVLVTEASLRSALPAGEGVAVVSVDADAERIAAASAENPERSVSPDLVAYVIYTSGSTGRPKGVLVPHRGVPNLAYAQARRFGIDSTSRVLQFASFSFDAAVAELFDTLLAGATLVMASREALLPGVALLETLRGGRVTVATLPPSVLAVLPPDDLPELRTVVSAGEAVDAATVERWSEGRTFVNAYGPTETTVCATAASGVADGRVPAIGRPLENVRVYVLDAAGRPAPLGVPGELHVGGVGVARGYLGRPGLTAERFVPDSFGEAGARLYRTGDRVRWSAEGKLEFLGRVDAQVKVRGFRIELGEIESTLRGHPAVRDCAVVARVDALGETRLVAYVVGGVEADELRAHLRRSLPDYMVPAAFVALDALPLNANGKVDRKALPAPEYADADRYVAPRTPAEEVLAGIWAEMLRVERVGAEDSFFDLGGHSLLGTRVAARVRDVFGVELPLRAVFEQPLLSALAAEIDRLRGTGAAGEGAIVPALREGDLPVTFAQERLWFVDALDPGSPAYAIPFSYGIAGHLDHDALRRALAELVRRHEPLRTTLPAVDGVPVQRIGAPPADFDLPVADLRHLPEDDRRAEAERLAAAAAAHRFELARGPLFRGSLVRTADDEHLLLLNIHHAMGDGWSVGVLLEELSALYGAFARGEGSPLPEPALQYADYAVWQRERLSSAALEQQVDFWRRALDGAPALLELPTDRPRPPVESHRGAVEGLVVSTDLTAEVHALARREGATLFMVLLAALDVVLGRLAGQDDVVVGTPIAGRTRAETDRMVGLFLNSLVLRTDLSGDPSFRELLGRVRETTLAAYTHQDIPFERVLEEVRPERSLAHAPVFQVMLNLANFQDGAFRGEGLQVADIGTGGELSSKFDLTLYVGERDGAIGIHLVYAADLFDAPRMRELLAQLEGVLRQAAAAPETRIGALSLATDAARGVVPDPAEPLDATWRGAVHEVFAAQAGRTPDALAVEDPCERWTYAELDAATDRIARALADAGVGVGDVVAITGHRSAALVRALVGTMKSGAAFLVLDPAYPAARLGDYVRIATPAAHLHLAAAADLPGEVTALLVDTVRTRIVLHPRADGAAADVDGLASSISPVSVEVGPDTLAYLSFTSGTTGTPKAVMGRHASLTHFTPFLASSFGLAANDRYSLLSGLAHDPLHRDVFTPLQTGAAVVAPLPDEVGTPGYLARWMREAGITVAHLTPAMGQLLADAAEGERIDSLRRAFFVGDVLRRADVARLTALAPALKVVNYYGSTETQRAVSFHVVDAAAEPKEVIPLGRGLPGVQLLVRNGSGEIAGIGEVGEIWMRSPHLAAGYLNDPALSAERFLVSPWTGDPRDRLYRTGDLGRYRPDGEVEPMGRADQQVKVRGFRVELGEVESALASHAGVKEAAVLARDAAGGDRRLVAWWVAVEGSAEPDAAALRAHLKALLPEYMVPSAYVRLDRLPLTQNGKLDRRALPEPEAAAADALPVAPRTQTEQVLAQIWAEVLRAETVGVDDDFFALGGHSLLATRLLSRVQNALGVVLPLRALFEGPTVAELAARVDALRQGGARVLPPVVRVDRDRPLPLSFAQERLWFLDRLEGGSAYNLPAALRLIGALDVDALERALGEIVRRHESLRTVFRQVEEGAVQVIAPFAGFTLPVDDLSGLDDTARQAEVRRHVREDAARPFDLTAGPLFRAALLRVTDEEAVLLLCIHHIVSDGWSTGVLLRELSALYAAYAGGADSPLAELPVQYADFAVWQREQLQGEVLDTQLAYWKQRLAGAPALLELPTDRPRPPVQSHRGARETFDLPRALLDGLEALGRREGATLYMVMLGAFQLLLSKYSGSEDIVVGSPIAGRTSKEVEELIGLFVNTLVLRTDLSADPTFRELLGRVREGTLGAYEHQEVPFERLVAELQPDRSLSHAPVFQVMFALQNVDRSGFGLAGLGMEGVDPELETTRVDLGLTAVPHDDGIRGALEYSTDLFDPATVQRMLGHLARVLEQVAADADVRLSKVDLVSADERALLVEAWNRTAAGAPAADRCIHERFEAQAARTPDAVAVEFEDASLTFAELNARANRLAHHLRSLGVAPETRVGICAERSLEMVVAVLAVLKAGGAYVPLDPGYPAERLAYMLADSAPAAVLVQTHLRDRVESADVTVVELDAAAPAWASLPAANPVRDGLTPEHLAYVIYTSGSTGRPKGVRVPHGSVAATLAVAGEAFGFGAGDRVPSLASFAFDIWLFETLLPLLGGATVRLVPRERVPDVPRLVEDLAECTAVHAVPALMRRIVEEVRATPGGVMGTLRHVFVGGDAVAPDLLEEMRTAFPSAAIHVLYGPTEAAIICATHRLGGETAARQMVGRPLGNATLYVVQPGGNVAPVGVPGELCLGGASVARDYLGRPGLTAERFAPDPFAAQPGARLYRTGDRVRWLADGSLEFLGRTDFQVKVRGFRIEPGEIEARLAEYPGVREALVLVREDAPGEKRLVAYVAADETAAAEALRAHLSERLPEYMVPAAYVRLDALPLTPNGKVDRKALPAPDADAFSARGYEAPSGSMEEAIAAIWAELLGAERVGRHDDFFQLGGNSLLATRLVFRISREMEVELSVRDVFEKSELSQLAQHLLDAQLAEFDQDELQELLALARASDAG